MIIHSSSIRKFYYNNWNFSKIEIQKYLNAIATTGIKFVELGFRFFESKEIKGLTAYTSKNLLKTLSVPKGLNIGIMINASDLIHDNQPKKETIAFARFISFVE